jgi:DNA polymerase I-like protein with 3'-5' exonuclease and polymerase domains
LDPYRAKTWELVEVLPTLGYSIESKYYANYLKPDHIFERLAYAHPAVRALMDARSLVSLFPYLRAMAAGDRLRGLLVPQRTGRFGYRAPALNGLPKHFPEAVRMRQLLCALPGYRLVGLDLSAFELRLIAGLSQDPALLVAANQQDSFLHLAQHFFGSGAGPTERSLIKRYLHAINYGQTESGFVGTACVELDIATAEQRYANIQATFPTLWQWRQSEIQAALGARKVITRGGWTRGLASSRSTARNANVICSTLVQGVAADIFRWCLRELDRHLPSADSFVVFVNHDEVFIAVPQAKITRVKYLARRIFERDVALRTSLVPNGIQLKCKVKDGATWADLI